MILSAYTDDKGQKSSQHMPSSQNTAPGGPDWKTTKQLTQFNKDATIEQQTARKDIFVFSFLFFLIFREETMFWIQVKMGADTQSRAAPRNV